MVPTDIDPECRTWINWRDEFAADDLNQLHTVEVSMSLCEHELFFFARHR